MSSNTRTQGCSLPEIVHVIKPLGRRPCNASGSRKREKQAREALRFVPKPKGRELNNLVDVCGKGVLQKKAFDCLLITPGVEIDFNCKKSIRQNRRHIIFVELKTTGKGTVGPDFENFFFSVSENQVAAAMALGTKYKFAFYNMLTGEYILLTWKQLLRRVKSVNVGYSLQT